MYKTPYCIVQTTKKKFEMEFQLKIGHIHIITCILFKYKNRKINRLGDTASPIFFLKIVLVKHIASQLNCVAILHNFFFSQNSFIPTVIKC